METTSFMPRLLNLFSACRNVGGYRRAGYGVAAILILAIWAVFGAEIIAKLNPRLGHSLTVAEHPALDVWITPPEYEIGGPMIISTPAGVRFENDTLTISQGSVISAHLAEHDGETPALVVDGDDQDFVTDAHGDFTATLPVMSGKTLSVRRGWLTLASWKIKVIADTPPTVTMVERPEITGSKLVRVAYKASDAFGVTNVALRVTPRDSLPGANNVPVDILLYAGKAKQVSRVDFADLTTRPWAGQSVNLQVVATNEAGRKSFSAPVDFALPERRFSQPIARILLEERKKLMLNPDDERLREETANVMAGIAHDTLSIHGDPVIMMALRSGAVRLVLTRDHTTAVSVNDILWQAATRIEDGAAGSAQRVLQDAQQDLANAVNRNATKQEFDALNERLKAAINFYFARMIGRTAPSIAGDKTGIRAVLSSTDRPVRKRSGN